MRSDDEIIQEIMEAGLGTLAAYGAKKAGQGALAAGKMGAAALDATAPVQRAKGVVRATNVYTKLKRDLAAFGGTQTGASLKKFVPDDDDLLTFAQEYYGIDATRVLAQAKQASGVSSGNSEPATSGTAAPAAEPAPAAKNSEVQAAAEAPANPAPATAQPSPVAQPEAPKAAPQAEPAGDDAEAKRANARKIAADAVAKYPNGVPQPSQAGDDGEKPDANPNVLNREKAPYVHKSHTIDFNDPHLQPDVNPIRSSRQIRDDDRLGREQAQASAPRQAKPPKRKRNESIEPTTMTFSEILAERETQSVKSQPVLSKAALLTVADNFLKSLARLVAQNPERYKAFMQGGKGPVGAAHPASHAYTSGTLPWTNQLPNNTSKTAIDRNCVNGILTKDLKMPVERIKEIERQVKGLNPDDTFKKLRQVVQQDEALKIVAALLKTLEKA